MVNCALENSCYKGIRKTADTHDFVSKVVAIRERKINIKVVECKSL